MRDTLDYGALGSNLGRQLMQGAGAYENAQTKMGQILAQQGAQQAHANLYNAQAAELQRRAQFQSPEYASKIGAGVAGLTEPQAAEMSGYMQRGNWGENVEQLPADVAGPPMATPKARPDWATPETIGKYNAGRTAHLASLGATGHTNAEQMIDAVAKLMGQGRIDSAIADPSKVVPFGRAMAASEGKPLFHQGANGVMDQFTGAETLNAVGKSAAQENLAQAGNAAASAALHRAQIPEVQSRIDLNRSKIAAPVILTDKDGNQTVYDPKAKNEKPPTEFQAKSATYGARAQEAHDILNALDGQYSLAGTAFGGGNGIVATALNPAMSKDTQKAIQAQRDFINAVLRQESGAVISDAEFDNAAKQYFPQPGDKSEVIEQKRRNRETAIMGFKNSAGKAAFEAPTIQSSQDKMTVLRDARAAISAGADRSAVVKRLKEMGTKEAGL